MTIFQDKHTLIYLNTETDGTIKPDYLIGSRVIPDKQYSYFFYIEDAKSIDTSNLINEYKVINGKLTNAE